MKIYVLVQQKEKAELVMGVFSSPELAQEALPLNWKYFADSTLWYATTDKGVHHNIYTMDLDKADFD